MIGIKTRINQPFNIKPNYVKAILRNYNNKFAPVLNQKLRHEGHFIAQLMHTNYKILRLLN